MPDLPPMNLLKLRDANTDMHLLSWYRWTCSAYLYDLFTVVVHEGSMNTGHYTNYCKWRGNWYRFDDDKVQPTSEAHVLQARAYQLCYRRRVLKNITNSRSQTHS